MKRIKVIISLLLVIVLLTTTLAKANDDTSLFSFGGDTFIVGSQVTHSGEATDDLFLAGESVQSTTAISGSLHAVGRTIKLKSGVGRDVYAAGMDVSLQGKVDGDATLAGYDLILDSELMGDLRASGSKVTVNGSVAGYALLAGESVTLNNRIIGDVSLAAKNVSFGSEAKIDGQLTIYEETLGELKIPESVIAEDRITRRSEKDFDLYKKGGRFGDKGFSWSSALLAFFGSLMLVVAIAALIAGVAPQHLTSMRKTILSRPFRTLGLGFVTQSALIGSAVLFTMTLIGVFFAPASLLLALIIGFLGYVIGAYAFGVGLMLALGRNEPDTFGQRALAAAAGAFVVALLGLIPFLGWLFVLAIVLAGIGAIITRMFRPVFFTEQHVLTD